MTGNIEKNSTQYHWVSAEIRELNAIAYLCTQHEFQTKVKPKLDRLMMMKERADLQAKRGS